jgi:hypothetical protein
MQGPIDSRYQPVPVLVNRRRACGVAFGRAGGGDQSSPAIDQRERLGLILFLWAVAAICGLIALVITLWAAWRWASSPLPENPALVDRRRRMAANREAVRLVACPAVRLIGRRWFGWSQSLAIKPPQMKRLVDELSALSHSDYVRVRKHCLHSLRRQLFLTRLSILDSSENNSPPWPPARAVFLARRGGFGRMLDSVSAWACSWQMHAWVRQGRWCPASGLAASSSLPPLANIVR